MEWLARRGQAGAGTSGGGGGGLSRQAGGGLGQAGDGPGGLLCLGNLGTEKLDGLFLFF